MKQLLQKILSQIELISAMQIDPQELTKEIKLLRRELKRFNDNFSRINLPRK